MWTTWTTAETSSNAEFRCPQGTSSCLIKKTKTGRLPRFVMPSLIFAVATGTGLAARAETDLRACYGETIGVSLVSEVMQDMSTKRTVFEIPLLNAGSIAVRAGDLHELPCQQEPVEAAGGVRGIFGDPVIHPKDPTTLRIDGIILRYFELFFVQTGDTSYDASRFKKFTDKGKINSDGYVFYYDENITPYAGIWLLPENYRSPLGLHVTISCGLGCDSYYRIAPNLGIRYNFMVLDRNAKKLPLLAIDKFARGTVMGWIKE